MTSKRLQRRLLFGAAAAGVSGLILYKAYRSDLYRRLKETIGELKSAGTSYSAAFLAGAEVSAAVLSDLRQFLQSDSDELPQSLRQLARLAQSEEVSQTTAAFVAALLRGAHASHAPRASADSAVTAATAAPDLLDRLLNALTSEKGQSLVGLAVSVACRTSVQSLMDGWSSNSESPGVGGSVHLHVESLAGHLGQSIADQRAAAGGWLQTLLEWAGSPEGERVVLNAVSTFVRQGTEVYMQSFGDANMWDDILAAAGNPRHRYAAEQLTRAFVNEAICSWSGRSSASWHARDHPSSASRQPESNSSPRTRLHALQSTHPAHPRGPSAPVHQPPDASSDSASIRSEAQSDSGHAAVADLDSAFEEGLGTCKPRPLQRDAAHRGMHELAESSAAETPWTSYALEVIRKPEARSLILAMTPVVVAEGMRSGMFCMRDLLFGSSHGASIQGARGQLAPNASVRAWVTGLAALVLMLWLASRVQTFPVSDHSIG